MNHDTERGNPEERYEDDRNRRRGRMRGDYNREGGAGNENDCHAASTAITVLRVRGIRARESTAIMAVGAVTITTILAAITAAAPGRQDMTRKAAMVGSNAAATMVVPG